MLLISELGQFDSLHFNIYNFENYLIYENLVNSFYRKDLNMHDNTKDQS